jgi:hypothetical protein
MAPEDYTVDTLQQDNGSDIGLDYDDLAIIDEAEHDSTKVVTKSPGKPFQLGYISVFCIIINKMIGILLSQFFLSDLNDSNSFK